MVIGWFGEIVIMLIFCIYKIILDVMILIKVNNNLFLVGKFWIEYEVCVYEMIGSVYFVVSGRIGYWNCCVYIK